MAAEWIALISGALGGLIGGGISLLAQWLSYRSQRKLKLLDEEAKVRELRLSEEIRRREVAYGAALEHWKASMQLELTLRRGAQLQPFKHFLAHHMELANQKWSAQVVKDSTFTEVPSAPEV